MIRPDKVQVFAENSNRRQYQPVAFGTNNLVSKNDLNAIANHNFTVGFTDCIHPQDLSSVLFYYGSLVKYLFDVGIAEFSESQSYEKGSVVTYKGNVYLAVEDTTGKDCCNPCVNDKPESSNKWCKLVTECELKGIVGDLEEADKLLAEKQAELQAIYDALKAKVDALKGVINFKVETVEGVKNLVLSLSDGTKKELPMDTFGSVKELSNGRIFITNPDGTEITLPDYLRKHDFEKAFKNSSDLTIGDDGVVDISDAYTKKRDKVAKDEAEKAKGEAIASAEAGLTNFKREIKEKGIAVKTGDGISGDGTIEHPLTVKFGSGLKIVDGKLVFDLESTNHIKLVEAGGRYLGNLVK